MTLLKASRLCRRYGDFYAIKDIDFDLISGEVHVLFGENGAGKSTLIAIFAGSSRASSGTMTVEGEVAVFAHVRASREKGISAVFQEFSLAPTLSVAQNIFLGDEPEYGSGPLRLLDRTALRQRARQLLDELGFDLAVDKPVIHLSRAEQQMVEIAKAFRSTPKILILDEPTASLSDHEVNRLFRCIDKIKAQGVGIIYVSHRIQEFRRIGDRITVLRDGRKVATRTLAGLSNAQIMALMAGRAVAETYPKIADNPGPPSLVVEDLSCDGVNGIGFAARPGEVLGIAGLLGSGKSRALQAVAGLLPYRGDVRLNGRSISHCATHQIMRQGLVYLPADRKAQGLLLDHSAQYNVIQAALYCQSSGWPGWLDFGQLRRDAGHRAEQTELQREHLSRRVVHLSGGNQQKVLFARSLANQSSVYIFDEPTVGVDVGARAALYRVIKRLCEAGNTIVIVSSDLMEISQLSHRLLVFRNGRIVAQLLGDELKESTILALFFAADHE